MNGCGGSGKRPSPADSRSATIPRASSARLDPAEIKWDLEGVILDIDRFSTHDGPGVRCTIFLKGCPLHCIWCHSPESIVTKPQLLFRSGKCLRCGTCVAVCPRGAQFLGEDLSRRVDWDACNHCGLCAESCIPRALAMAGTYLSVSQVVETVRPYTVFFENSGGGITISGGEATAQPLFTMNLLKAFKSHGISTAIETCGFAHWEVLASVVRYCDLVLYDLKHMDPEMHRRYTGVGNELVVKNLKRLARLGKDIQVRMPVIPGYNDSEENIRQTVGYAAQVGVKKIVFLPWNPATGSKYQWIGKRLDLKIDASLLEERLARLVALASGAGLAAQVGG